MEKRWLVKEENPDLILFALGWACDPQSVAHIRPAGYDILCTYDYRRLSLLPPSETENYRHVYLLAWSFGVRVSESIFRNIRFRKTIALNGTPHPVSNRFGIPVKPFLLTLRGIRSAGTEAFERRTYGKYYPIAAAWSPSRPLEEKAEELESLYRLAEEKTDTPFAWDAALVGSKDLIFPPENQLACWQELYPATRVTLAEGMPHYPFSDPRIVLGLLE